MANDDNSKTWRDLVYEEAGRNRLTVQETNVYNGPWPVNILDPQKKEIFSISDSWRMLYSFLNGYSASRKSKPPLFYPNPTKNKNLREPVNLIFLDIDGVLNDHFFCPQAKSSFVHPEKINLLNWILAETDAKVVISSAWRYIVHRNDSTLDGLDWLLRICGMHHGRFIGITKEDTLVQAPYTGDIPWVAVAERGEQIAAWLRDHEDEWPCKKYIVIDDRDDLGIAESGHPFVRTNFEVGLTKEDAEKVIAHFQE